MSRQYFFVEVHDPRVAGGWLSEPTWRQQLAEELGVSERQIIVVEGAHVHAIEVQDPGDHRKT